jgi:hypothetical protein
MGPLLRSTIAFLALTFGSGCASYLPFSQELRDEHRLETKDLKNLQFYTSHTITLRREAERGGREITPGHKLLLIAGKQIEEVVIEKHTPGIVVGASGSSLEVSFAEGSSMTFSLRGPEPLSEPVVLDRRFAEPPDPFPGNRINRPEPEPALSTGFGNYYLTPRGRTVEFQGKTWDAVGESDLSHLVISTESLEEVQESETVLKGRTL